MTWLARTEAVGAEHRLTSPRAEVAPANGARRLVGFVHTVAGCGAGRAQAVTVRRGRSWRLSHYIFTLRIRGSWKPISPPLKYPPMN
jgi:hypothetical protein